MSRRIVGGPIAIVLMLAACAGGATFQNVGSDLSGGDGGAPGEAEPSEAAGELPGDTEGLPVPAERRIIKTGEVSIEVDDVGAAIGAVRTVTQQVGGYVGGSQAGTLEESATLTLRVPADRFEETLLRIRELGGTIVAESTREEDVTPQVVDLQARIDNLSASEASYRALAERAEAVDDVLAVQARLGQVRGEIEQLQAQLDNVSGQAALSTLTVRVTPRAAAVEAQAAGWDPGGQLDQATATLVGVGQAVVGAAIWLGIVVLPLLLLTAVVAWTGWRVLPALRRRIAPHRSEV